VLDDGEHNATLERSGIEGSRGSVLMKTDMRSYTCLGASVDHPLPEGDDRVPGVV
jgi:hypothetical protein